jgi:hypothetical protein
VGPFRPMLAALGCVALVVTGCGSGSAGQLEAPAPVPGATSDEPAAPSDPADPPGDTTASDDPAADDTAVEASEPEPAAHAPAPAPAGPFELSPDEMLPNAKRLAAEIVQTLLTYEPDDTASEIAGRVAGDGRTTSLLVTAAPLLHADAWSRGEIVYPQLGGFTDTSSSVMVVARQTVGLPDGEVREETRTFDVRLTVEDGDWVFDELASAGGRARQRPDDLSEIAAAVVDDDRIELPDTARWDIYRGVIEEPLLELMALMAERTDYGVIVLDTGHPWEVFGTDRQSRHSLGRAVDLYRLSGPHVIDDREDGSETHDFVQWLYEQPEMANMGAPWSLDGFGGRSFTDDLHQDHLHIESRAGDPEGE